MPRITIGFGGATLVEISQVVKPNIYRGRIEMLGFTPSIYKTVLLKYRTSTVVDRDSVLTVQPNLRYLFHSPIQYP